MTKQDTISELFGLAACKFDISLDVIKKCFQGAYHNIIKYISFFHHH